jgi:DNA polymerase-3 subunit gamma/tau
MSYEVLARKWRPQIFEDVVGQEHITRTLANAIAKDRLAHAYLFSGARGVGKTSVARILAKALNCTKGDPGKPCNQCPSCEEVTRGSSVDVQEIDGASNRGIDEIRELRDSIKYMPSSSPFRIFIIDEVHMLTLPAFNALLKTLEEPPPHVKFIFATTEPHKVPVTILSRCQRFDFKRIPLREMVLHLEKITEQEGIKISQAALTAISREAEGSMRDAESLLDQVISFSGNQVQDKEISEILGFIDRETLFSASQSIIEGRPDRCLELVEEIYGYGYDIKEFYRALMDQFRNLLVSLLGSRKSLLDCTEEDQNALRSQAEKAGQEKLRQALNILIAREEDLRFSSHPRLVLETVMIALCRLGQVFSIEELIGKIEGIENRFSKESLPGPGGQNAADRFEEPEAVFDHPGPSATPMKMDWNEFLSALSKKNKAMASILKEWRYLDFEERTLTLAKGGNAFSATYLDDPERRQKLLHFCQEFLEGPVTLEIQDDRTKDSPAQEGTDGEDASSGEEPYGELPPPVQQVLSVFDGVIKKENPPRSLKAEDGEGDRKKGGSEK